MEILNIKDTVKTLLEIREELRDDDTHLITSIWMLKYPNVSEVSFLDFVIDLRVKKLINPESIRRCRQKLQQEYPELRGKKYNDRLANQDNVKEQLKNF